ncbi:MAG TPA: ATP-binding cassette domain-containing protein, partial [Gammaproteobacteria bacterium]|nr:ATP-binding cassette domain-containing protein [Gammaproteobacteria bacterium]
MVEGSLVVEHIFTAYDKADVLTDVSITARAGEITCILGSNGSGKSTLVRSVLGLTPPRKGRIVFDGQELAGLPTHRVIAAGIACIPEGRKVFPKLTVEENLRIGAYQQKQDSVIRERFDEVYRVFP